jgi:hypothetical protein
VTAPFYSRRHISPNGAWKRFTLSGLIADAFGEMGARGFDAPLI